MGFYNIILEGQQAEEYKARKAKEAEEKYKENEERVKRRLRSGIKTQGDFEDKYYNDDPDAIKDQDRFMNAKKVVQRDDNSRFNPATVYDRKFRGLDGNAWADDRDAVNRHMRRHPDQWDGDKRIKTRSEACGIFESVEFLNKTS